MNYLLSALIFLPVVGTIVVLCLPREKALRPLVFGRFGQLHGRRRQTQIPNCRTWLVGHARLPGGKTVDAD